MQTVTKYGITASNTQYANIYPETQITNEGNSKRKQDT